MSTKIAVDELETQCCGVYRGYVFVFGSNLAGRHGRGAARHALECHGAVYGMGRGLHGASYAIPTKDTRLRPRPFSRIAEDVAEFLNLARSHGPGSSQPLMFYVTRVGCGLAGYADADMAPLFRGAPANCVLPRGWR